MTAARGRLLDTEAGLSAVQRGFRALLEELRSLVAAGQQRIVNGEFLLWSVMSWASTY